MGSGGDGRRPVGVQGSDNKAGELHESAVLTGGGGGGGRERGEAVATHRPAGVLHAAKPRGQQLGELWRRRLLQLGGLEVTITTTATWHTQITPKRKASSVISRTYQGQISLRMD